ncbi:MAG: ABC transporter substrate-binding protein [Bdellovibrionales bacterium]|nr:ABC transporter substrate-binding protein [Bdellovibrionales bacterium]
MDSNWESSAATGVLADFYLLRDLGAPIQMIVATDYSLGDTLLAGKHIRTAHDLIGKRIGIAEMNSWAEYFIFELLRTAGIDPEKVQFRTFAPDQIPKAIQDGEIDAGHTWDPVLSAGIKSGLRPLLSSKIRPQLVISGLAVREEILGLTDDGYSVDVGLVQAIFEAQKIATDDPVRFARIVQRFLFTNNVEWSESSIIESMTRNTDLCDLKKNTEGFAENGVFRVETTNISNFFEARGVTSTKVAAIDLLNDNAIRRIEDETTLHAGKSTPQAGKTVPN